VRAGSPPVQPVLIFDGECGFCRRWVRHWRRISGGRIEYLAFQDVRVAERFPEIPRASIEQAVHLVEPDGRVSSGAEAVFRLVHGAGGRRGPLRLYEASPLFARATEWAYRVVARHRAAISAITRWRGKEER
jgi:predicted DCC family thiol-disulfide oxidoreductase YuxK